MSYSLEFNPAVRDEVESQRLWYELQRPGSGDDFYGEVIERLDLVIQNPQVFAADRRGVRLAWLKSFLYLIRYRIMGTRVRILSVVHSSRVRGGWNRRR